MIKQGLKEEASSLFPFKHLKSLETVGYSCLLYTSDAADERSSVDLGGRRIIKKKNTHTTHTHTQQHTHTTCYHYPQHYQHIIRIVEQSTAGYDP